MPTYRVGPKAGQGLEEIWSYIAGDNPDAADKFIETLLDLFDRISENPGIGRARPEFAKGVSLLPHRRYRIAYKLHEDTVVVLRVVHSRRQLPSEDYFDS
jgi:toxin ParE1/3/4